MRGLKRPVSWKAGHHRNCIIVQKDLAFFHDGVPIDKNQKPIGLFQELVSALTYPKEWILDVCSGTGNIDLYLHCNLHLLCLPIDRKYYDTYE